VSVPKWPRHCFMLICTVCGSWSSVPLKLSTLSPAALSPSCAAARPSPGVFSPREEKRCLGLAERVHAPTRVPHPQGANNCYEAATYSKDSVRTRAGSARSWPGEREKI
jgi:hypothetical protein